METVIIQDMDSQKTIFARDRYFFLKRVSKSLQPFYCFINQNLFYLYLIIVHSHDMLSRKAEGLDPVKP